MIRLLVFMFIIMIPPGARVQDPVGARVNPLSLIVLSGELEE